MTSHEQNCLSHALSCAQEIYIAMAQFPKDHAAQGRLNRALHHALIIAEEGRQAHEKGEQK